MESLDRKIIYQLEMFLQQKCWIFTVCVCFENYLFFMDRVFCTSFILLMNFCLASYSSDTLTTISDAENITSLTRMGALSPSSSLNISNTLLNLVPFLYLNIVLPSRNCGGSSNGITNSGEVISVTKVLVSFFIISPSLSLSDTSS